MVKVEQQKDPTVKGLYAVSSRFQTPSNLQNLIDVETKIVWPHRIIWICVPLHLCGVTSKSTVFCGRLGQTRLISLFRSASYKRCTRTPGETPEKHVTSNLLQRDGCRSNSYLSVLGFRGSVSVSHQMPIWSRGPCESGPSVWRWSAPCCHLQWACSSSPSAGRHESKEDTPMNQKRQIHTERTGLPLQVTDLSACDTSVFQVVSVKQILSPNKPVLKMT